MGAVAHVARCGRRHRRRDRAGARGARGRDRLDRRPRRSEGRSALRRALDKRYRVEPESAELVGLVAARPSISTEKFGREVRRGWMTHAIANRLASTVRRPLPLAFRELKPTVTKAEFGPVIVIQRGANVLTLYNGEQHGPHLRRRHRLGPVPLPGRHVVDRRQAAESVVAPARLGVGQGCEADSARAGEPARHALDGSFGRRGRYPRNARRGLDRLLGLARLHPHARARGGVAVQAGRHRHPGRHRLVAAGSSPSWRRSSRARAVERRARGRRGRGRGRRGLVLPLVDGGGVRRRREALVGEMRSRPRRSTPTVRSGWSESSGKRGATTRSRPASVS